MRKLGKGEIRIEKNSYHVAGELHTHPHAMRFCTLVRKEIITEKSLPLRCALISDFFLLNRPTEDIMITVAPWAWVAEGCVGKERRRVVCSEEVRQRWSGRLGPDLHPNHSLVFPPISHLPAHPYMLPWVLTKTQARNSESWFSKIPKIKIKQHMVILSSGRILTVSIKSHFKSF